MSSGPRRRTSPAMAAAANSFDTMRVWDGSQARAFEELAYQLLKDGVPVGTAAIRTGNPDGGVEWYATLPDGSEWGWQAKHFHDFDQLLAAMRDSVKRVVRDRRRTVVLTFVISTNLTTGNRGGRVRSQRDRYNDAVVGWKRDISGAKDIDFFLVQESDLLDLLARPEHRGRQWFWWNQPVFTPAWFEARFQDQAASAQSKYRPDLQVDLPIQVDIDALGFDAGVVAEFEDLRRQVAKEAGKLRLVPSGPPDLADALGDVLAAAAALTPLASNWIVSPDRREADHTRLIDAIRTFIEKASTAEGIEREIRATARETTSKPSRRRETLAPTVSDVPRSYAYLRLREAATDILDWLESPKGEALRRGCYFLVGAAGSGKTHLFLDAVRRGLDHNRPAVVVAASRFGRGDLWASLADQLGLPHLGADVLLGAMNSAGEASSLLGSRFVLLIDALNETPESCFWRDNLPALRAAITRHPYVGLAVSCRDTYLEVVDEERVRDHFVLREHPGFAGRELEATQRYFEHYGLEAPRIPLLVPEFTVPLFLRMYCEGLAEAGGASQGHEGRVRIFERFLVAKIDRAARRQFDRAATGYEINAARRRVQSVLDALLDELGATGREAVKRARGEEIATNACHGAIHDAERILGALQTEGVLSLEMTYLEGQVQEGFRVLFQAFADFLILRRRLTGVTDARADADLPRWLTEQASWGVLDAAAVVLPERYKVELPDLLGATPVQVPFRPSASLEARIASTRARRIYGAVIGTLPYRDASAVTERTIEILNDGLRAVDTTEVYRVMFQIAPQPGNLLNGESLHRHLAALSMPRRDASFGFATRDEIGDETSPTAMLGRWAAGGPYPTYDRNVIELSAIPLVWLLTSPNRYMRDWVTKALVELLRAHLDVALRLLERFWGANDPYVVQRVLVISYGALMRWRGEDRENAAALVTRVQALAFTPPVRADELLLDAALGVVEWGVAHGLVEPSLLAATDRPYGLTPPSRPPTDESLRTRYGYTDRRRYEESFSSIYSSVLSMGDFGRYVVEDVSQHFSRYRVGTGYPPRRARPSPRLIRTRWRRFLASLTAEQRGAFDSNEPGDGFHFTLWASGMASGLTEEQQTLLSASWTSPRHGPVRQDAFSSDLAKRWVMRRVVGLGWTPRLFGEQDRRVGYGRGGREAHKAERWGKKYQWMAFHELLARIADNYHALRSFDDWRPYSGLHQLTGRRDIDPSVPPLDYRLFVERADRDGLDWRRPHVILPDWPPAQLDFRRYEGDIDRFVEDRASEPTIDKVLFSVDADGDRWVLLEGTVSQGDPAADEYWRGLQQPLTLHSLLVPRDEGASILEPLLKVVTKGPNDVFDGHGHVNCCYAGEVGWSPRDCYHYQRDFRRLEIDAREWRVVEPIESVIWESGGLDCSTENGARAIVPSSFVQARAPLVRHEAGPSWRNGDEIVFTNYGDRTRDRSYGFLVRADWLAQFLRDHSIELVVVQWHQRWEVDEDRRQGDPWEEVTSVARLDASMALHHGGSVREAR